MDKKQVTKISKFLSLVLRHSPETIGIELDANGWTNVSTLLNTMQIMKEELEYVVENNNKKRFEFSPDKLKIRASQGHSVNVDLDYEAKEPPAVLYHGTAECNFDSILKSGILKGKRNHVHLSRDLETAIYVGMRHGKPIVFEVHALEMHQDGYEFFCQRMVYG